MTSTTTLPGGTFTMAPDVVVTRLGYGSMQLAGPRVMGAPADVDEARAVLRNVVDAGITHIDTSDYYGPHITNRLIRETLFPYPGDLHLITKVGSRRDEQGGWPNAQKPDELRQAVHENLENLGLDALDVVNLRIGGFRGPEPGSLEEPFTALAELQQQGLIRHLGVSNVSADQVAEARSIAPIVCVQNAYNLADRASDGLLDALAAEGIAFVPFFPLGGFSPLQSETLDAVAADLGATPMSVALAWLLQRSPNILLIPGTSKVAHLQENIRGAALELTDSALTRLNGITG